MVRVYGALLIGGAIAIIPLGVGGGIPLFKLLFFALAALIGTTLPVFRHLAIVGFCRTGLHSLARQIRTVSACAPCSPVLHCITLFTFFAVVFLSPLWSAAPFLSVVGVEPRFEGVMAYGVFLGLAIGAGGMVRAGREQFLLQAVAWSNVGVVLYGLLQVAGKDPFSGWWDADVFLGRVFSTVGQPNMLGQFLVLTAPLAVLTAWRRWRTNPLSHWERVRVRGFPIIAGVVLVLNLIVLFATGSRAGMLGALVVGGFYLLSLYPLSPRPNDPIVRIGRVTLPPRGRGFCLTLCVVFLVMVLAFLPFTFQRFSLSDEWDRSLRGRVAIWRDAVSMIRARPVGWGLETTGLMFPRFQSAPLTAYESLTTSVDRAHSKPLDLLLTVGPLGFLSYYAFLLLLFLRCFLVWRSRRDHLVLAGMAGLAGVSASLLFGFEGVVVHAFFWLICGMLTTLTLPSPFKGRGCCEVPVKKFPPPFKGEGEGEGLMISISCVLLLVIVAIIGLWLRVRFTMERAERAFQSGDVAAAVQLYDGAARSAPWDRALLIRFIETALLARERAADPATQEAIDAVLAKRLHHLERLTGGSDPLSPSLRAWYAALRRERTEALASLDDARLRAPFSIPRLRMAWKVAELLGDASMREAVRAELTRMLPPWWDDPADPRFRILWKENPWLEEFLTPSPIGRGRNDTL